MTSRSPGFPRTPTRRTRSSSLRLRTDDGIEGLGVAYFGGAITKTLRHAIDELGALIIGDDPLRVEASPRNCAPPPVSAGPAGILTMAMSAIDVALWDIKGKALGLPLWKLLGGGRDKIATYASGALRRGLKLDEAVTAAGGCAKRAIARPRCNWACPASPRRRARSSRRG